MTDPDIRDWIGESRESIMARLDGAKAAQGQVRAALVTLAVISLMMLTVSYNANFSYDSEWVRRAALDAPSANTVSEVLRSEELKSWVSAQAVQISLLGVHVSVDDAPVIGTFALAIVSFWLVLLMRRENHTVGFLLRATDSPARPPVRDASDDAARRSLRWLIYYSLMSTNMFATFEDSLARVDDLNGEPIPFMVKTPDGWRKRLRRVAFGFARGFFFLFPAAAAVAVWMVDVWSYFRPDPFANMHATGWTEPFLYKSATFYLVCLVPLVICCLKSNAYSMATNRVLGQYAEKLSPLASRPVPSIT